MVDDREQDTPETVIWSDKKDVYRLQRWCDLPGQDSSARRPTVGIGSRTESSKNFTNPMVLEPAAIISHPQLELELSSATANIFGTSCVAEELADISFFDNSSVLNMMTSNESSQAASRRHSDSSTKKGTSFSNLFYGAIVIASICVLLRFPFTTLSGLHANNAVPLPGVRPGVVPTFTADVSRRDAVVEAFKHAWLAYERDAMGDDEYHPLSHRGSNLTKAGGIGYTVVDSIDTMLIMGLHDEYQRAREWTRDRLSFDRDADFSTFETTIRVLGGLLAAYHLSEEDPIFLEKAQDLGNRILPVFDTPSGLPLSMVNLQRREGVPDRDNNGLVSTAEAATLQLELRYLSYLTGEDAYWEKSEETMAVLKAARLPHGLVPIFVDPSSGRYRTASIRLGSRGDSYYEYLLLALCPFLLPLYAEAMTGIHDHLIQTSVSGELIYTAEINPEANYQREMNWKLVPKQDHLVCFLGGSLMLGATTSGALVERVSVPPLPRELSQQAKRDWLTGVELVKTCMTTHDTQTGLSAEIVHFRTPGDNVDDWSGRTDWYIKGSQ
ncbi:glycoside hydrolase [Chiua virens]|nr:glycoside hydrolase [Chiua virens]